MQPADPEGVLSMDLRGMALELVVLVQILVPNYYPVDAFLVVPYATTPADSIHRIAYYQYFLAVVRLDWSEQVRRLGEVLAAVHTVPEIEQVGRFSGLQEAVFDRLTVGLEQRRFVVAFCHW